jgi:hypothetical protein
MKYTCKSYNTFFSVIREWRQLRNLSDGYGDLAAGQAREGDGKVRTWTKKDWVAYGLWLQQWMMSQCEPPF